MNMTAEMLARKHLIDKLEDLVGEWAESIQALGVWEDTLREEGQDPSVATDIFADKYPFGESFDELGVDVEQWVKHLKRRLESGK